MIAGGEKTARRTDPRARKETERSREMRQGYFREGKSRTREGEREVGHEMGREHEES